MHRFSYSTILSNFNAARAIRKSTFLTTPERYKILALAELLSPIACCLLANLTLPALTNLRLLEYNKFLILSSVRHLWSLTLPLLQLPEFFNFFNKHFLLFQGRFFCNSQVYYIQNRHCAVGYQIYSDMQSPAANITSCLPTTCPSQRNCTQLPDKSQLNKCR